MSVGKPITCPSCGRALSPDVTECPYCGEAARGAGGNVPMTLAFLGFSVGIAALFASRNVRIAYFDSPGPRPLSVLLFAIAALLVFLPKRDRFPGVPPRTGLRDAVGSSIWRLLFCLDSLVACNIAVSNGIHVGFRALAWLLVVCGPVYAFMRGHGPSKCAASLLIVLSAIIPQFW